MRTEVEYEKGSHIYISVNSNIVAAVEDCKIYSKRKGHAVSGYGDNEAFGISLGSSVHYITLKKISMENAVSFRNLSNFTLTIAKKYETLTFSGCEWTEISENITPFDNIIETATICAKNLSVEEVSS